jgi:uncharacterized membrane protein
VKQKKNEPAPEISDEVKNENEFVPGRELPPGSESPSPHQRQTEEENPAARTERSKADRPSSVEVLHDVLGLITTPEVPSEVGREAEKQRQLNEVVHSMLVLGIGLSTAVMCMGIALSLVSHSPFPSNVSTPWQVITGLDRLSPSSFLSLGILLLIATPIFRVFGSLIEFIISRDLSYAGITLLVLIILTASVLVGRG